MKKEIWKDVPGWEMSYQASNYGNIRSLGVLRTAPKGGKYFLCGRILKQGKHDRGYRTVGLHKNGVATNCYVHRLVLQSFVGNQSEKEVNHKDGNKANNRLENLEWVTPSENQKHSVKLGIMRSGERHPHAKLTNALVKYIRENVKEKGDQRKIAKKLGVTDSIISEARRGISWRTI